MKLRIKQPISPTRVLIGAGFTVLGIYILRESSELIGLILLLVWLIVGIRGSATPIINSIVFALFFSLVVLFLFWTTPHTDGWTIEERQQSGCNVGLLCCMQPHPKRSQSDQGQGDSNELPAHPAAARRLAGQRLPYPQGIN